MYNTAHNHFILSRAGILITRNKNAEDFFCLSHNAMPLKKNGSAKTSRANCRQKGYAGFSAIENSGKFRLVKYFSILVNSS